MKIASIMEKAIDYQSLFENAIEGIFQTTEDGRYLIVNNALAEIYGYYNASDLMRNLTNIGEQLYKDPNKRPGICPLDAGKRPCQKFSGRDLQKERANYMD